MTHRTTQRVRAVVAAATLCAGLALACGAAAQESLPAAVPGEALDVATLLFQPFVPGTAQTAMFTDKTALLNVAGSQRPAVGFAVPAGFRPSALQFKSFFAGRAGQVLPVFLFLRADRSPLGAPAMPKELRFVLTSGFVNGGVEGMVVMPPEARYAVMIAADGYKDAPQKHGSAWNVRAHTLGEVAVRLFGE